MAIDKDRLKEDATNILKGIGKFTPGGILKGLIEGKEGEILKVVRALLSGTAPGRAVEAVQILVDRYKLPESVAKRIVANEMTDANMPVDPSGSADEGFPSRPEFESSAEDTSVPPERKIKRFPGITREMISELLKDRRRRTIPLPRPIPERFPDEDRFYPEGPGKFPNIMPELEAEYPYDKDMIMEGPYDDLSIPMPMLKQGGRVNYAEGTKMASVDDPFYRDNESDRDEHSMRLFGKPYKELNASELEEFQEEMMRLMNKFMAKGGRVEYAEGTKMASDPDPMDERNNALENLADQYYGKPLKDLTPKEIEFLEEALEEMSKKPIAPRMMAQTGGITESRVLPPEFIEAAQRTFLTDLATQAGMPSVTTATTQQPGETAAQFAQRQAQAQQFGITRAGMAELAPKVADETALQVQARGLAGGLGSFQPFLTKAGTAADAATALTGTGAGTGVGSIASYTSPYQQQVIDTTMAEFDRQAQIRANQQAAATLGVPGAFGGGREGVQRAEYQAASDRNRAATFANLQQQGFQNAAARRQQDLANQMSIANTQAGLGARAQDFSRAQISGLGTLGAAQQAQQQAVLDAQRQAAQMAIDEPRQALARFGQGIAGITPGAGSIRIGEAPAAAGASPLMKALGLGLAGADIYGRIF